MYTLPPAQWSVDWILQNYFFVSYCFCCFSNATVALDFLQHCWTMTSSLHIFPKNYFDSDDEGIPKEFVSQIFLLCDHHNNLDEETSLQYYDKKGEVCEHLGFMILQEICHNNRHIATKSLYILSHFLPVTKGDSHILHLSNKAIDCIIGGLEKSSDIEIDITKKTGLLYNQLSIWYGCFVLTFITLI